MCACVNLLYLSFASLNMYDLPFNQPDDDSYV